MGLTTSLKQIGRQVRAWPPLNRVATSVARGITGVLGWRPDVLPRHLHRVGEVKCTLPNGRTLRIWSRGDDWVSNRLFWFGWKGYEPETVPLFCGLAEDAAVTFDVGSYVGFYSLVAAVSNPSGHVHAFEPMSAIFARLQKNVALNRLANVTPHHLAIGDSSGAASFYFHSGGELPTSSSLSRSFTDQPAGLQSISVRVRTLDDFVRAEGIVRVDLMKIDTETTEPAVLRGATMMLQRDRPHIFCEVLQGRSTGKELDDILRPLGYHFYLLTPGGPQRAEVLDGHPEYLNYLFSQLGENDLSRMLNRNAI